jgi:small subunit ribosomal protein S4
MARFTDSVCSLCERCSNKLLLKGNRCLTPKCAMERRHTQTRGGGGRRRRVSDRGLQLIEKQKGRYVYGLGERQFRHLFEVAAKASNATGDALHVLLERRFDNVVFRLGFADSRAQARQLVSHGHITLNGRKMTIPSASVKAGDKIAWGELGQKTEYFKALQKSIESKVVPNWLNLDRQAMAGQVVTLPSPADCGNDFNGQAVVEFYSR